MQDIDFDELDKAVHSVLGASAKPAVTPTPVPEVTPITPATEIHTPPTAPQVVPRTVSAAPNEVTPSQPTQIRRSTGRFMDVVHPSSDMRSANAATPVFAPEPEVQEIAKPELTLAPLESAQPLVEAALESQSDTTPLETPFLSDAKVEKRPLGAFSTTETESAVQAPIKPPMFEPSLEISEEALIGASETADTDPTVSIAPDEPSIEPEEPKEPVHAAVYTQPLATSITQQYVEHSPSEPAEPTGAIFDTESYHQPLLHPAKKKSSLPIVLWILGLIVLGVGLGAVLFFFVLQPL